MVSLSAPAAASTNLSPAVEVRGLTAAYGDAIAISRVSFSIPRGLMAALVGPAGAGKSTLLRCMASVLPARAGDVQVLGSDVWQARELVSYLAQTTGVDWQFPLSLAELVLMGRYRKLGFFGRPSKDAVALATACLAEVGLPGFGARRISELRSSQRWRALLARALMRQPELLLLDEPFEGADGQTQNQLYALLEGLCERGTTVLAATRDYSSVARRFQHVVLLNGQVIGEGPTEAVLTSANLQVAYGHEPSRYQSQS